MSALPILRAMPAASKPAANDPPDLIGDLSDWSCDNDVCGINGRDGAGPCPACERRARGAKLLAQRDLERRPCTLDCSPGRPCERCAEIGDYLTWLYQQRDQGAIMLRALRHVANVFPEELAAAMLPILAMGIAEIVVAVLDEREATA